MDPGRYGPHQGWENNSALEGYRGVHEPDFRAGGSYDDRRFLDDRFSRDGVYPRGAYHRDILEGEHYPRRSYEEVYPVERDSRRHEKPPARYGGREHDDPYNDYDYKHRMTHSNRADSRGRDYEYSSRRDGNWRRRESRERERDKESSRERDPSPYIRHERSRSRSRGHDDRLRSRSPRSRSHSRSHREDSYDDGRYDRSERWRDRDDKRYHENYSVAPSATVVVKGLSQKTTEEDLYQILDAAQAMMDKLGDEGLVVDSRKLFFEYSSKPTGGPGGPGGLDSASRSNHGHHRSITVPSDWMCTICGCVNFARRTSCFQCNEPRTDDAPPADMTSSNSSSLGRRGEAGPTHVLVVRGLDENADDEMLRYEFSKHAPIKDLRLVRDKFTHVSRGFAFVHFYSVEEAAKALEATNGTTLEKNGQILRVAYAKSILGPGSSASQASSLAAAAIEAATFSQQYDAVGWAPKEYNPDDKLSTAGQDHSGEVAGQNSAPQSGFVWDEASGYYYDATSGFYYDGNTGLYYDGNNGIWYSYDQKTQQYVPCTNQNENKPAAGQTETAKSSDCSNTKKVVISAPASTVASEKAASLPDAIQAAASAAIAAEKKEKEKAKEIKLASKNSILSNKKKMSNVLSMWKQRSHEGQAPRVALEDNQTVGEDRSNSVGPAAKTKLKAEPLTARENPTAGSGLVGSSTFQSMSSESQDRPRPLTNSSGGTLKGVIRGSGLGVVKSDTLYSGSSGSVSTSHTMPPTSGPSSLTNADASAAPFRTDASALGSYTTPVPAGSKRRFSEMPSQLPSSIKEQSQATTTYRDRAAERRSLYGSSSAFGDDASDHGDPNRDSTFRRGVFDPTPFPLVQSFEVITADRVIDESNVGNRMLRSMGWQEGLGLGKDGSGMVEPVQAQSTGHRAGLGSQPKKVDPTLEAQSGDSYKTLIQKKAIARFREMS
ncbi:unnamed protein product [Withania somnifera]